MKAIKLDKIQRRAVGAVLQMFASGSKRLLVVAPPGAGKTEILAECIGNKKTLFVVHQRDLAVQTMRRLSAKFGADKVSAIMSGYDESPNAQIYVATVQTLLNRGQLSGFELLIVDEAHHYVAETWGMVRHKNDREWLILGATATPERDDGTPLGDMFEHIITAGSYSELIECGRLVPAHVVYPERNLGSHWAQNPVDAWARNGGKKGFFFAPSIKLAEHYAEQWSLRKVMSACISEDTKPHERARIMDGFASGKIRIITSVATMLEGINVPDCEAVILGRPFRFRGTFLQATGRVLRAYPGKRRGLVIDLTGATIRHGRPDSDREYSLDGKEPISGPPRGPGPDYRIVDPQVRDVPLIDEIEDPVQLPDPDPEWLAQVRNQEEKYLRDLKRYGRKIADSNLKQELGL